MSEIKERKYLIVILLFILVLVSLIIKSTYALEETAYLIVHNYMEGTTKSIGGYQKVEYTVGDKYTTSVYENENYELVYSSSNTEGIMISGGQEVFYYYRRKMFSVYDYCDFSHLSENVQINIKNNIEKIENGEIDITYELFGALGDGVTDDSYAIKATHDFVNAENIYNNKNFVVKGTEGKTYYIGKDTDTITIVSDVDWQGAKFIIDDGIIDPTNSDESKKLEKHIFRVFSKIRYRIGTHSLTLSEDTVKRLGVEVKKSDKQLKVLSDYINNLDTTDISDYVGSSIEQIAGIKRELDEASQYLVIVTDSTSRYYIRGGTKTYPPTSTMGESKKDQFIMDKEGNLLADVSLDFDNITQIGIFPIYDEEITIKNGHFLTKTNNRVYNSDGSKNSSIARNLYVYASNVTIDNITHELDEDTYKYVDTNYQLDKNGNVYTGFIETGKCANFTISNSKFSAHSFTVGTVSGNSYNGTYDLSVGDIVNLTFDNVSYVKKENQTDDEAYYENILNNETKWSTLGMNYVKNLIINNSKLNSVSSHKGTYNVTINNSVVGKRGIILAGGGSFDINDSTIDSAQNLIKFHEDYGSNWEGDVKFNNIKYQIPEKNNATCLLNPYLAEDRYYGFQSYFPNVEINKLEIDDTGMMNPKSKIYVLCYNEGKEYALDAPYKYYFPEKILLSDISIKNRNLNLFMSSFVNKGYLKKERYNNTLEDNTYIIFKNVPLNIEEDLESYHIENGQFIIKEEVLDVNNVILNDENKIIYAINNNITIKKFLEDYIISKGIMHISRNETKKDENEIVKTGDSLKIEINNKSYEYQLSVLGDVTGDGKINIADVAKIYKYSKNKLDINKTFILAGDVNFNGVIDDLDIMKLYSFIRNESDGLK